MKNGVIKIGWKAKIFIILTTAILSENVFAAGYDSTYVLSIKQKFAIPENVINGDYVGIWKKTYTWNSGNAVSFSIKENYNSAFSINSSTGLLTIADASKINGKINKQDTVINLIIRSSDSKLGFEDDTCEVRVKESKYCVFIDYSYSGSEIGTRSNPFNDFSDIIVKAGYGYFIKRGNTSFNKSYDIYGFQATSVNPTIISAYASGNNPLFDGKGLGSGNETFDFKNSPSPSKFCYIYNLDIQNYPSMAIRVGSRSSNFGIYNCVFKNNILVDYLGDLGDIYLFGSATDTLINWKHELINLESSGSWGPILKTDASGVTASNIKSNTANEVGAKGFNFRFAISYNSKLSHFLFIGGERSLQVRFPDNVITDGIIINSREAGMFLVTNATYNGKPDRMIINNVLFRNNENGIYGYNTNINYTTIENCRFEANTLDGIYFHNGGEGRTIQNCSFINNGSDGIELYKSSQASNNLKVYYNLFYGNKGKAINAGNPSCASNLYIYNNTINGIVDLTGASNEIFRNNFFESVSSVTTSSNNVQLSTISLTNYFKNPAAKNFELISSAINAIDKGYNVGLKYDCLKVAIYGQPDIGAFEYKASSTEIINLPPVINGMSFILKESDFQNNLIGKVVASDPNAGQQLSFSIISGNENGLFLIDAASGNITSKGLVFGADTLKYQLTVKVTDNASIPLNNSAIIKIVLLPKSIVYVNNPPKITNQSFYIHKSSFSNNFIGKIIASDADPNQKLTYSILSGNGSGIFSLDPVNGDLKTSTQNVFSADTLKFQITVKVTDNGTSPLSQSALITVYFIQEAIKIPTNSTPVIHDQVIKVHQKDFTDNYVGKISASDPDLGQKLTYSIVQGNNLKIFNINSSTGELSTTTSNIFSPTENNFKLQVQVVDNGQTPKSASAFVDVSFISSKSEASPFKVYPNPSKGRINTEIDFNSNSLLSDSPEVSQNKSTELEIIDISGKVKFRKQINYSESIVEESIDLDNMPDGLYFVRIKMSDMVYSKKLILNR